MLKNAVLGARVVRALAWVAAATMLAGLGVSPLCAQTASIVKVEEQWELVVAEADADRDAPQVTVVMSPQSNLDGLYAAFELNHQSQPTYVGAGLQLQVWNNETAVARRTQKTGENLVNANETVTWTQKMEWSNGQITFDVDDGASTSWGAFGDGMLASVTSSATNLNSYSPAVSVSNSGVGFGSHRVTSLKLKKVTYTLSTGHVLVDDTVRVAFPKS